ncbi:hypothetical protein V496_02479 [Pseudogymnoascus sp. VKM F-4515 (FW-2607)]|nr:hypothetical protein V496_02479 [Pseudogymnoascus sp. VKM F-4515 (FW-2607)]
MAMSPTKTVKNQQKPLEQGRTLPYYCVGIAETRSSWLPISRVSASSLAVSEGVGAKDNTRMTETVLGLR